MAFTFEVTGKVGGVVFWQQKHDVDRILSVIQEHNLLSPPTIADFKQRHNLFRYFIEKGKPWICYLDGTPEKKSYHQCFYKLPIDWCKTNGLNPNDASTETLRTTMTNSIEAQFWKEYAKEPKPPFWKFW